MVAREGQPVMIPVGEGVLSGFEPAIPGKQCRESKCGTRNPSKQERKKAKDLIGRMDNPRPRERTAQRDRRVSSV